MILFKPDRCGNYEACQAMGPGTKCTAMVIRAPIANALLFSVVITAVVGLAVMIAHV